MDKVSVTIPGFVPAVSVQLRGVSGGGGTSDYNMLRNKPTLNGVEIKGNKTSEDYGIIGLPDGGQIGDLVSKTGENTVAWVTPASRAEQDNTRPITSAAVYTEIGNINALLATI